MNPWFPATTTGLPPRKSLLLAGVIVALAWACGGAEAFDAAAFWNMDAIRKVPLDVEVISTKVDAGYRVDDMYFTSEVTPDGPTRVYCPFARPEHTDKPVPLILWLHPGGAHADAPRALWIAQSLKCAVLDVDWSGQWVKGPKEFTKWRGPGGNTYADQYNIAADLKGSSLYHIIIASRRALDFAAAQPDIDMSRVCAVGGSWGSYLTNLLVGVDSRVRYAFCGAGAGGFHQDSHGKIASGANALPPKLRQQWIAAYDPASYAAHVTASLCQEIGSNDWFFWLGDVLANFGALPGEKRLVIRPNNNHGTGGRDVPSPLFDWPKYCLGEEKPFLDVAKDSLRCEGRRYEWQVTGGEAAGGTLYFSPGNPCWPARYWLGLPGWKHGDHWMAELPPALAGLAGKVFVNVADSDGRVISSGLVSRAGLDPATRPGPLWPEGALWDVRSGAEGWRPTGPANNGGPGKPSIAVSSAGILRIATTDADKSFVVLTNSVILASGHAVSHGGIRLVVGGSGQPGALKVILQRNSGSTQELDYTAEAKYGASATAIELAWSAFQAPASAPKLPYPFDGLRLDGDRSDNTPVTIEGIGFLK